MCTAYLVGAVALLSFLSSRSEGLKLCADACADYRPLKCTSEPPRFSWYTKQCLAHGKTVGLSFRPLKK